MKNQDTANTDFTCVDPFDQYHPCSFSLKFKQPPGE